MISIDKLWPMSNETVVKSWNIAVSTYLVGKVPVQKFRERMILDEMSTLGKSDFIQVGNQCQLEQGLQTRNLELGCLSPPICQIVRNWKRDWFTIAR